jgi:hypothetical protein
MMEKRIEYRIWVRKPTGKILLGRPRRRSNVKKIDLLEIGWDGMDWIRLAEGRHQWRASSVADRLTASQELRSMK